jgi:hypothetical protein
MTGNADYGAPKEAAVVALLRKYGGASDPARRFNAELIADVVVPAVLATLSPNDGSEA